MTETELIDRLREAIVLDGPDAWRNNGYLQDAQAAGLPLEVALKRANEVSQEVSNNTILFQNIQARIARLAQPSRSHLIEQDMAQIVNAARSLKLSSDFVRNRWVPAELARLKPASAPPEPTPVAVAPVAPPAPVAAPVNDDSDFSDLLDVEEEPVQPAPIAPIEPPAKAVVPEPVPEPPKPPVFIPTPDPVPSPAYSQPPVAGPAPVVRQFMATPARIRKGESVTLEWDVENLLAVTIDDLGEGLSPKNRGWIKPSKTADYTLFDANNNPLSTVRVEVIPRDYSGLYGVLFALALLAMIYFFVRNNNATPVPERKPDRQTQPTTKRKASTTRRERKREPTEDVASDPLPSQAKKTAEEPIPIASADVPAKTTEREKPVDALPRQKRKPDPVEETPDDPMTKPSTPADARTGKYEEAFGDKPYDKVELGTDDRGWRRARSNGRWGFINEADEWVIQPEYEAVTPFRGNTAAVFLNGQLMTINREGKQIRK
ncbi:MAG TPA: WG repeat-containing protein [Spirosoma sp.]|nr:WG repeat-containing protein [Spirosoma sp.]